MVDIDARRRLCDRYEGYRQLLSLASPPPDGLAPGRGAIELSRAANDSMAEWTRDDPSRFPGFIATIAMSDPSSATREAERAIKQLGAAGVQIYSNVNGRPLDLPEHLEVIEAIATMGGAIWLHPLRPSASPDYPSETMSRYDLWWLLGWPHETSVAMGRLGFAGLFDRCPNLTVITHHGGGTIPMMAGRLRLGMARLGDRHPPEHADLVATTLREPPIDAFRRFHADTATFGSVEAIRAASDFFGVDRLLFASDMPFDREGGSILIRETLRAIDEWAANDADREKALEGNARRLLRWGSP